MTSTIEVIDPATRQAMANWPTAPAQSPHGIAAVPELGALLVAGGNGRMVLMSQQDGRILSSAELPTKVDQIAYDAEWHRVYAASGLGKIAVLELKEGQLHPLGEVESHAGAHSIAVDPGTHNVWTAWATKENASFVQSFTARP
jgi:hypothetical protein